MAFYVAVGPRGLIFRAGMIVTGVIGPLSYWCARSRRTAPSVPRARPVALREDEAPANLTDAPAPIA
jgi:hypothetical protein